MTDIVTPKKRSAMMSGIKGKNTKPELLIRKALYGQGFRYRLHHPKLPGKPDIVMAKYNSIIFIHGCFWHMHGCHLFKWPSTRPDFWHNKIQGNQKKDSENLQKLFKNGWRVLIIWECSLKGKEKLDFDFLLEQIIKWINSNCQFYEITGRK
ncbi:MAG: DNA mismatch endonuclease Vsr [Calditrichaeota bacterium]|nr:MAG: DNA mismatch endonuclease Vsr [Calditrichota bacterium]